MWCWPLAEPSSSRVIVLIYFRLTRFLLLLACPLMLTFDTHQVQFILVQTFSLSTSSRLKWWLTEHFQHLHCREPSVHWSGTNHTAVSCLFLVHHILVILFHICLQCPMVGKKFLFSPNFDRLNSILKVWKQNIWVRGTSLFSV